MKRIRKYKTFEEAQFDTYVFEPDKTYFDLIFSMFSISILDKIGKKVKKGIYKYKTFQEAQRDKLKWLLED